MDINSEIPWRKFALIAELTKRLSKVSPQFGKTVLEKVVFLLQEVFDVDFGYDFELYTYGPFTAELLGDLDVVEQMGAVQINPVLTMSGGYFIQPTEKTDRLIEKEADTIKKIAPQLKRLTDNFGTLNARELELRASIVFIERSFKKRGEEATKSRLLEMIKDIKPKYQDEELQLALSELVAKGFITFK